MSGHCVRYPPSVPSECDMYEILRSDRLAPTTNNNHIHRGRHQSKSFWYSPGLQQVVFAMSACLKCTVVAAMWLAISTSTSNHEPIQWLYSQWTRNRRLKQHAAHNVDEMMKCGRDSQIASGTAVSFGMQTCKLQFIAHISRFLCKQAMRRIHETTSLAFAGTLLPSENHSIWA